MAVTTFAAISIGSYELEMKIFEMSPKNGIREVDRAAHVIELGHDTYNDNKISFEMLDKMCEILSGFHWIMSCYKTKNYVAAATSAIREALNSQSVLDQIKVRTGFEVTVLSNSEQRFLSYKVLAVREKSMDRLSGESALLVDVGAGSVQITLFDKGQLVTTQNIRLGVLRVREALSSLAANAVQYEKLLEEYIDNDLATFTKIYLNGYKITYIIGIGENLSYVSFTDARIPYIEKKAFFKTFHNLIGKSEEELSEQLDIPLSHASLIIPSLMIFMRLFCFTDADALWTPNIKLCDGIAVDYALSHRLFPSEHNFEDDILSATRQIAKRYQCNTVHTAMVEDAALKIYDAMKKRHGLGSRERFILRLCVILHDTGKYVSLMYPAEASYNIIRTTEIIGLSHEERMTIARVVKYNTADFDYTDMSVTESKLTAILRLANALDRSHRQKLQHIRVGLEDSILSITASTYEDIVLENGLFKEKAKLFEEIYGVKPVLRCRRA